MPKPWVPGAPQAPGVELHKHFIGNPSQKKAKTEEDTQMAETKDDATEAFPELTGCLMIFGGP